MSVRILVGDALTRLKELPDASVHTCITSPPYWGLRSYQGDPGMIGLEPTFDEHLENLVAVFREVRRVLRDDGICAVNYGDAYAANRSYQVTDSKHRSVGNETGSTVPAGLKPKDLMMMPARVAMALQADGWWLRSEVIWHKPNPMPESATDRPTSAHEKIYLLSKSPKYFYDHTAVRLPPTGRTDTISSFGKNNPDRQDNDRVKAFTLDGKVGANMRNVLKVATHSFKGAHFATFPPDVVRPWIAAGTSEHGCCSECGAPWVRVVDAVNSTRTKATGIGVDSILGRKGRAGDVEATTLGWKPSCECDADVRPCTVMDPFGGSGTVGLVADQMRRDAILIEISPEYAEMARGRITGSATLLADVTIEHEAHHDR